MNLHTAFKKFDETIILSKSKADSILKSREAVRDKIRNYFKNELHENQPRFKWQGSFAIHTALNPINENEVDIDDGLYLNNVDETDEFTWPTPKEIHNTIMSALEGHTQDGYEDKTSCVRVIYKKNYHVDIPIYIMKNGHALLANKKTNEWEASDSKDFRDWYYKTRKNDQTSRIVRYLKAWRDYKNFDFASIELTILVAKHHVQNGDDSIALKETLAEICNVLTWSKRVDKPVSPFEDLWGELSDSEKDSRIRKLEKLRSDVQTAINASSAHRASIILREQFGERFPLIADDSADTIKTYSVGAKPWA